MSVDTATAAAPQNTAAAPSGPAPKAKARGKQKKISPFRRSPSLLVGTIIVGLTVLVAIFPDFFAHYGGTQMLAGPMLTAPNSTYWFGTDNFGYDIYSRVIYATRLDLLIGVGSAGLPFIVGSLLGLVAGYYGGKFDAVIMRILDIFVAFPFMVLAIAIVAILGNGVMNLLIAMWIVSWPPYTRLVRSEVLVAKNSEYVQAAKTLGYSDLTIIFRHILPNVISSSIVYLASDIVMCIMTAASMSFLGLGVPAPTPEWGSIISAGKSFITGGYWWISTLPGLVMMVVGLGFSLFGDGLNDLLRTKD